MVELRHALGLFTKQHIDQMHGAESLPCSENTRQRFLGRDSTIPGFWWVDAVITITAGIFVALAKIVKKCLTSALNRFTEAQQRIKFLLL